MPPRNRGGRSGAKGGTWLQDTDKGYRALMRKLKNSKNGGVQVGIFGESADRQHEGALTVGDIAEMHEYGLGQPERSWLRAYVDQNQSRIRDMLRLVAIEHVSGRMDLLQGLDQVGLKIKGEIQQRIRDGIEPPNAASTVKRKGSSTPLIDTGQFWGSIGHLAMLDMVLGF